MADAAGRQGQCFGASTSSCRRGPSGTRGPGSRCSRSRACRATRSRRSPTRPRCTATPGWPRRVALHIPWDKVDDYAAPGRRGQGAGRHARHDQRQRVPGRRLHAGQRHQPRPADPAQGPRPPARMRRRHGRDRLAGPEAVVLRRHELPRPGQHPRPPGPAGRRVGGGVRAARRRPAAASWSTSCSSRRSTPPTCPTGARRSRTACSSGRRRRSCVDTGHHAPGTNIEFIVAFLLRAGKLGAFDFNSPLLRRRRPDGRRGRPVPAVPDHVRGRRAAAGSSPTPASPSCSTSATTSSPRSPARSGR